MESDLEKVGEGERKRDKDIIKLEDKRIRREIVRSSADRRLKHKNNIHILPTSKN
jgi:hypothetical protein